eukprot:TRINITY_DN15229_c0_g1_i1.p1 TRINITY_DN15229_c0_g1~~TRINITY_DN15229_c0_g1_i1.p1  ORF type:complete len:771 (-),score=168.40 TRINITY_DN15229_c0_g1_i1:368-2680(-)
MQELALLMSVKLHGWADIRTATALSNAAASLDTFSAQVPLAAATPTDEPQLAPPPQSSEPADHAAQKQAFDVGYRRLGEYLLQDSPDDAMDQIEELLQVLAGSDRPRRAVKAELRAVAASIDGTEPPADAEQDPSLTRQNGLSAEDLLWKAMVMCEASDWPSSTLTPRFEKALAWSVAPSQLGQDDMPSCSIAWNLCCVLTKLGVDTVGVGPRAILERVLRVFEAGAGVEHTRTREVRVQRSSFLGIDWMREHHTKLCVSLGQVDARLEQLGNCAQFLDVCATQHPLLAKATIALVWRGERVHQVHSAVGLCLTKLDHFGSGLAAMLEQVHRKEHEMDKDEQHGTRAALLRAGKGSKVSERLARMAAWLQEVETRLAEWLEEVQECEEFARKHITEFKERQAGVTQMTDCVHQAVSMVDEDERQMMGQLEDHYSQDLDCCEHASCEFLSSENSQLPEDASDDEVGSATRRKTRRRKQRSKMADGSCVDEEENEEENAEDRAVGDMLEADQLANQAGTLATRAASQALATIETDARAKQVRAEELVAVLRRKIPQFDQHVQHLLQKQSLVLQGESVCKESFRVIEDRLHQLRASSNNLRSREEELVRRDAALRVLRTQHLPEYHQIVERCQKLEEQERELCKQASHVHAEHKSAQQTWKTRCESEADEAVMAAVQAEFERTALKYSAIMESEDEFVFSEEPIDFLEAVHVKAETACLVAGALDPVKAEWLDRHGNLDWFYSVENETVLGSACLEWAQTHLDELIGSHPNLT